jgi:hypothetical protein
MPITATDTGAAPGPQNLAARLVGIITSPGATYRAVVAHPKWLGVLAVTTVLAAFFTALPLATEAGRNAALDRQVEAMESMKSLGVTVTPEVYQQMERRASFMPYTTAGSVIVMGPLVTVIIAGILFGIFSALMGGEATFKQAFTVVAHASIVSTAGAVFSGAINYFRGGITSVANLGALLPMLPDNSFAGQLLGTVDVFVVWWVVVLAIGLGVLYRRRTQPIAISLLGVYAVIALIIAVVKSRLGGA